MKELLIKEIRLVNPAKKQDLVTDILIRGNKIAAIAPGLSLQESEGKTIDGKGLVAAPGLVDVHVHFRDPGFTYKEDIETGARAAAAGGYTTVVLMANTKPAVDNVDTLKYVLEKGRGTGIHVETCSTVTVGMEGKQLAELRELKAAGAVGFTDDGKPLLDAELVKKAMCIAKELNVPISFHEEDPAYILNNGIHDEVARNHFGLGGSPREAEMELIARDLKLAEETGATITIQHISSKEGVELVRKAKEKGVDVHAEATPHHFSLTQEAVVLHGTLAKMNPPLRTEEDRQAILEGLRDGTIDLIATDHAPHAKEEKDLPLEQAPSGIVGLETALPLAITNLVKPGVLSLSELVQRMSLAPARLYHLPAGELYEDGPADLVIFSAEEQGTVQDLQSKSKNSPFLGDTLYGVVHYTICDGNIVWERPNVQ